MSGLPPIHQAVYDQRKIKQAVEKFYFDENDFLSLTRFGDHSGELRKRIFTLKKRRGAPNDVLLYTTSDTSLPNKLVWRTPQKILNNAMMAGFYRPESLVCRVLFQLGQYNKKRYLRLALKGVVDARNRPKNKLILGVQQWINHYRHLERKINNYDLCQSVVDNRNALITTLEALFAGIRDQAMEITNSANNVIQTRAELLAARGRGETITARIPSEQEAEDYRYMCAQLFDEMNQASIDAQSLISLVQLATQDEMMDQIMRPSGLKSIGRFIREAMLKALVVAQRLNQNLTILRGDLNSAIEDARKEILDDTPDHKNPVSLAQQGIFSADPNAMVYVDSATQTGNDADAMREFALMACALSGAIPVDIQRGEFSKQMAPRNSLPKWRFGRAKLLPDFRPGLVARAIDGGIDAAFLLPDFFKAVWLGRTAQFAPGLRRYVAEGLYRCFCQPDLALSLSSLSRQHRRMSFPEIEACLHHDAPPVGSRIGVIVRSMVRSLTTQAFSGAADGVLELGALIGDVGGGDLMHGHFYNRSSEWQSEMASVKSCFHELQELVRRHTTIVTTNPTVARQQFAESLKAESKAPRSYGATAGAATGSSVPSVDVSVLKAIAPAMTKYHSPGLLNALAGGARSFVDLFEHHLYTKHPVTGLFFTLAYMTGAFAIISPEKARYTFGKEYVKFSNDIGTAFAHGTASTAVASGFVQAKLVASLYEFCLHGADSWFMKGMKYAANDPGVLLAYTMLAVSFGRLLAFHVNIPWLTQHLRQDIGSVPFLAEGFAGLKVGVVLMEAFTVYRDGQFFLKERLDFGEELVRLASRIKQELSTMEHKGGPTTSQLTVEEERAIRSSAELLLGSEMSGASSQYRLAAGMLSKAQRDEGFQREMQRVRILVNLSETAHVMKYATRLERRKVTELIWRCFDAETARSLVAIVNPVASRSMMGAIFYHTLTYPGLVFRAALSPISGSAMPWYDLGDRLHNDMTSTATAMMNLLSIGLKIVDRVFRTVGDIVGNALLSRIIAWLASLCTNSGAIRHGFSRFTYGTSIRLSMFREWLTQIAYTPIYWCQRRHVVHRPDVVVSYASAVSIRQSMAAFSIAASQLSAAEEGEDFRRRSNEGGLWSPKPKPHPNPESLTVPGAMNPAFGVASAPVHMAPVREDDVYVAMGKDGSGPEMGPRVKRMLSAQPPIDPAPVRRDDRDQSMSYFTHLKAVGPFAMRFFTLSSRAVTACFTCCRRQHAPEGCEAGAMHRVLECHKNTAALFSCMHTAASEKLEICGATCSSV